MAWYNGGNWLGLDGTQIPHVLAELCNALNERLDCLGKARYSWTVNVGTQLSPVTGPVSTNLNADHFCGLTMWNDAFIADLTVKIENLLFNAGAIDLDTRHVGFAKVATNTGLAEEGDLWTTSSVVADAGMTNFEYESPFYLYRALYCKELLDRMVYPVIYPSAELVVGKDNYLSGYDVVDNHDVEAVWDHAKGYPAWRVSQGFGPSITTDLLLEVRGVGDLISNPPPVYVPYYAVFVHPGATWEISNLNNESGAGYLGEVVTQWASVQVTRPGFDITDDTNDVPVSFLGGSANMVHGLIEFTTPTEVPLDGTLETDFVSNIMVSTDNPFNGVRTTTTGGVTATGVGYISAEPNFKFITSGSGSTNAGFRHMRQILDISAYLSDQT